MSKITFYHKISSLNIIPKINTFMHIENNVIESRLYSIHVKF